MFARSGKPGNGTGGVGRGSAGRGNPGRGNVQSITGAPTSHTDDLRGREKRYLISMGVRTVCFLLAIVVPSPWRWGLVAAAVFLPYVAVVIANAGRDSGRSSPPAYVPERPQLEATSSLQVGPTIDANRAAEHTEPGEHGTPHDRAAHGSTTGARR